MIDVTDQYETGQEYMSRYQAVDKDADRHGWENRIRLKGIDVTVYAYALYRCLERIASRAGVAGESAHWRGYAERTARAVREVMWDAAAGMFFDVDPRTMQRTGVSAAVCFYPYFTDLAGEEHLAGLERNLLDPARFWTAYPVPSSALDDPYFNAIAEWKGKRHVCPWNGRVWPMTNSHVMEALGRWGDAPHPRLRAAAGQFLPRFVRMMFHDGDLDRPNCYEHYNPFTGAASVYRGIDDYQHSWVADLIIQCVGVRVHEHEIGRPIPMDLDYFELRGVRAAIDLSVRLDGGFVTVTANDALARFGETTSSRVMRLVVPCPAGAARGGGWRGRWARVRSDDLTSPMRWAARRRRVVVHAAGTNPVSRRGRHRVPGSPGRQLPCCASGATLASAFGGA
jgi:hypothetical protein